MRRLLTAALLTIAVLLPAEPAHAASGYWAGQVCQTHANYDAKVCSNVYVNGQSQWTWLQVCAVKIQSYSAFSGISNAFYGSIGATGNVPHESAATYPGGCENIYVGSGTIPLNTDYYVTGTMQLRAQQDIGFAVCGWFTGGRVTPC